MMYMMRQFLSIKSVDLDTAPCNSRMQYTDSTYHAFFLCASDYPYLVEWHQMRHPQHSYCTVRTIIIHAYLYHYELSTAYACNKYSHSEQSAGDLCHRSDQLIYLYYDSAVQDCD